jgi:hypothetical protein
MVLNKPNNKKFDRFISIEFCFFKVLLLGNLFGHLVILLHQTGFFPGSCVFMHDAFCGCLINLNLCTANNFTDISALSLTAVFAFLSNVLTFERTAKFRVRFFSFTSMRFFAWRVFANFNPPFWIFHLLKMQYLQFNIITVSYQLRYYNTIEYPDQEFSEFFIKK